MHDERLETIRHDIDLFLPRGSYSLERQSDGVRLVWDGSLPDHLKHFSAEVLRLYGVRFETEIRSKSAA